jgi:hypothetical protein
MAAVPLNPIITNPGLAAAISALGNGLQLSITHIQLGTGVYTPAASGANVQTALASPIPGVYGVQPIAGGGILASGYGFQVSALFPEPAAPFTVGEIGFWSGDPALGTSKLFAVYAQTTGFVLRAPGAGDYAPTFVVAINALPPGTIAVTVDGSASIALSSMHTLILNHETDPAAHNFSSSRTRRMFRNCY